jgi:hypothetical protein
MTNLRAPLAGAFAKFQTAPLHRRHIVYRAAEKNWPKLNGLRRVFASPSPLHYVLAATERKKGQKGQLALASERRAA